MLVRPLSREVRLLGTTAPLVVVVVPSILDRAELRSSTALSRMFSRIVLEGDAERGDEKAELKIAADGLVSMLSTAEAGRLVSGLAISSDVADDVRLVALACERTESMETADSGGDEGTCTGAGVKEVIRREGVLGEERGGEEKIEVVGEGGFEEEFAVAEDPFR
jgi:hypothetical protein